MFREGGNIFKKCLYAVLIALPIMFTLDTSLDWIMGGNNGQPFGNFLRFADKIILRSSAIIIDPSKQLLLTLYMPSHSKYYLPQTVKSPYETSDEAITRSVLEDTGLDVSHLHTPLSGPDPAALLGLDLELRDEPTAITTHFNARHGTSIVVSWYSLTCDFTAAPFDYMEQQGEEVKVVWMKFPSAIENLTYGGEKIIAKRVFAALEKKKAEGMPVVKASKEAMGQPAVEREFQDFLRQLAEVPEQDLEDFVARTKAKIAKKKSI